MSARENQLAMAQDFIRRARHAEADARRYRKAANELKKGQGGTREPTRCCRLHGSHGQHEARCTRRGAA